MKVGLYVAENADRWLTDQAAIIGGPRTKGLLATAAILHFARATEQERQRAYRAVAVAEREGSEIAFLKRKRSR